MSHQQCPYALGGEIITLGLMVSKEFDLCLLDSYQVHPPFRAPSQQHTPRAQTVTAWLFADSASYCEICSH